MAYQDLVLADTPLAYYRLGDASGTAMTDTSVNGRNGTYVNSPTLAAGGLLVGNADTSVDFDGVDDHGAVTYASWMDVGAFTIEAWVRPDVVTGDRPIATHTTWSASSGAAGRSWHLIIQGSQINFGLAMTDGSFIDAVQGPTLATGVTRHIVGTWDGTTVKLFLDGALVYSTTTLAGKTLRTTSEAMRIGSSTVGGAASAFFDGRIDEVAHYSRALAPSEVQEHYVSGAATLPLSDNFNKADSASVVGAPQTGPSPTSVIGTWGITGNRLYCSAVASTRGLITWNVGTVNIDVTITQTAGATTGAWLIFGMTSTTDGWGIQLLGTGSLQFGKFSGTTFTGLVTLCITPGATVPVTWRFVHNNGVIEVYMNGVRLCRTAIPYPIIGTTMGLHLTSTTVGFDDLLVVESSAIDMNRAGFSYRGRDTKTEDEAAVA